MRASVNVASAAEAQVLLGTVPVSLTYRRQFVETCLESVEHC